jgi:hypothetical protein
VAEIYHDVKGTGPYNAGTFQEPAFMSQSVMTNPRPQGTDLHSNAKRRKQRGELKTRRGRKANARMKITS